MNIDDFNQIEPNVYMIEPGYLFTSNFGDGYAYFLRDEEKFNQYYAEYLEAVEEGTIPFIEGGGYKPPYLDRAASYATFKKRHNLDDRISVFDLNPEDFIKYDNPKELKFLYMNPFLIKFTKSPNLVSTYLPYVSNSSLVDFTAENSDSYVQFVIYNLYINRSFQKAKKYDISLTLTSTITVDESTPIIKHEVDEEGNYIFGDKYSTPENDLRVVLMIKDRLKNICFTELHPVAYDKTTLSYTFEGEFYTNDHITNDNKLTLLDNKIYRNKETGCYYKVHDDDNTLYDLYDKTDTIIATDIPVDEVTEKYRAGELYIWCNMYNMSDSSYIRVPMNDVECKVYTIYSRLYNEEYGKLVPVTEEQTNNIFTGYEFIDGEDTFNKRIWTNEYSTSSETVTFMKALSSVRTYLSFEDYTKFHTDEEGKIIYDHDIMDCNLTSLSFVRASEILNKETMQYFFTEFLSNYLYLIDIIQTRLRNATNIDVKFYNTYGRSRDFLIGENNEVLDTVNLSLSFDMWFVNGTDTLMAVPEVKEFIKKEVESLNNEAFNNLFISNLMRKIETSFAYVDHIRFNNINAYDTDYQAVKSSVDNLDDLSVEERRFYVPELLICDIDDIIINEYFSY